MGTYAPVDYPIYLGILLVVYYLFLKVVFTRIKLDGKFLLATAPYVVVGVLIRVLADLSVFTPSKYWSITPGVYLVTIAVGLFFLSVGWKLLRDNYWIIPFLGGCLLAAWLFYLLAPHISHPDRILYPLGLAFFVTMGVYLVARILRLEIFQQVVNLACVFAHLLDGAATYVAYNFYGFGEEHLLPRYLIELAGNNAAVMVPIKLILILTVLYLIEKYAEKEEALAIKLMIFILGFGPGLRNILLPSLELL